KPHQSGGYGVGPVAGGRRCGRATAVRLVTMQLRPPPDRSHSTRVRWRLFRPWIEKLCSRVLRKLSGELTTIQYWAARPPPDFRLRRDRPDLAGLGSSGVGDSSEFSDTRVSRPRGSLHLRALGGRAPGALKAASGGPARR